MAGEVDKSVASAAETIFLAARSLSLVERPAYLAAKCGDNSRLRSRVEALLKADLAPDGFLPEEHGTPPSGLPVALTTQVTEEVGDSIGHYKLLQQIGEGGCGVVYMAEQEQPVRRKVALKIIKLGMDTKQVVARFEAERQALAIMDHPSIAKVYDAGATETGRPYFVMELVRGIKITDFCEQNQFNTHQRLDLFIQVCRAVQHAHQKGIIHRDLKPSNILVASHDGESVPKVIDFGIAKATQGKLTDQTVFTAFEQLIGTPAYMSPEQAQLGSLDVDTRSDIYSLGVLLYELLTGKTPFDTKELLASGLDAMRRTILEKDPPTPSTRLKQELAAPHSPSLNQSKIKNHKSKIPSDLDWIVMKCLEKDRSRRYQTANGLAQDLQRHLSNEPVIARPPGRFYEFQKTVRRHKFGFGAAAAIMVLLAAGTALSTWEAVRATRNLWSSYASEARALRLGHQSGQHFNSIAVLRKAAAIRPSLRLRNEAVASMALADLRLIGGKDFSKTRQFVAADLACDKYAVAQPSGTVSIRRVSDDVELERFPLMGNPPPYPWFFSRDGNRLACHSTNHHLRVWDCAKHAIVADAPSVEWADFTADSQRLAIADGTNITVFDLATGKKLRTLPLTAFPSSADLAFLPLHPSGRMLPLLDSESRTNVAILDIESGQTHGPLRHPGAVFTAVWHPDGRRLATGCADKTIHLWDATEGRELLSWRTESCVSFAFNHQGDILASSGWDGRTRLWNSSSGRELVSIFLSGGIVGFSPDDRRLLVGTWGAEAVLFLETTPGVGLRTPYESDGSAGAGGRTAFSSNGQFLAADRVEGTQLWDGQNGQELDALRNTKLVLIGFDATDKNVIVTSPEGLFRWPVRNSESGSEPLTLMNRDCADRSGPRDGSTSPDGKICGIIGSNRCQIFRTDTFAKQAETGIQRGMRFIAFSPDNALLATGAFQYPGVKVWNARTGELLKELPAGEELSSATVAFSPDNRELVISTIDAYHFWKISDWSLSRKIDQERGNDFCATMAFSRDGRLFAGTHTRSVVRLYDAATGNVLADLEAPNSRTITALSFNHDGTQLAAGEARDALRIWDLRAIRQQLAEMGLDWEEPPYPPATPASASRRLSAAPNLK